MYLYNTLQPVHICFPEGDGSTVVTALIRMGQLVGLRACRRLEEVASASVAAIFEH